MLGPKEQYEAEQHQDRYELLGRTSAVTTDEVRELRSKLLREHHPDRGGNTALYQEISEACDVLLDSELKEKLDGLLKVWLKELDIEQKKKDRAELGSGKAFADAIFNQPQPSQRSQPPASRPVTRARPATSTRTSPPMEPPPAPPPPSAAPPVTVPEPPSESPARPERLRPIKRARTSRVSMWGRSDIPYVVVCSVLVVITVVVAVLIWKAADHKRTTATAVTVSYCGNSGATFDSSRGQSLPATENQIRLYPAGVYRLNEEEVPVWVLARVVGGSGLSWCRFVAAATQAQIRLGAVGGGHEIGVFVREGDCRLRLNVKTLNGELAGSSIAGRARGPLGGEGPCERSDFPFLYAVAHLHLFEKRALSGHIKSS